MASVLKQLEVRSRPLVESGLLIGRGIVTGLNEAFFVDEETARRLIAEDAASAEVLKPLVVGDDVRRYHVRPARRYLLYLPHGVDISRYPAVEKHLAPYRDRLERRATTQAWYELQQLQEAYREFFNGPKLLYPVIARRPRFAQGEAALYCNDKCFFVPGANPLLLALLNSRLSEFYFRNVAARLEGGQQDQEYLEFRAQYVELFPVPRGLPLDATGEGVGDVGAWLRTLYHRGLRRAGIEPAIPEDIRGLGARIGELRDVERVLLIGSWARGQAEPDSDVDLLVVCPADGGEAEWRRRIREHLGRVERPLDLVVYTPEQLRQRAEARASAASEFLVDGIELYAAGR